MIAVTEKKKRQLSGQEHRKQDEARNEPSHVPSQLWEISCSETSSAAGVWERAKGRMQCQPSKRHKRLGTVTPEHFHSPATAIWIPHLHLCCAKHCGSRAAALALQQGATKVLVMGLTRPYCFPEPSLLPNLVLHCLGTYQGLPWSYHEGLLHNVTPCLEELP